MVEFALRCSKYSKIGMISMGNNTKYFWIFIVWIGLSHKLLAQDTTLVSATHTQLRKSWFLNLGLGFPTFNIVNAANSANFGTEPNLELGTQWYFYKNSQLGIGPKVSWAQIGFSMYNVGGPTPTSNWDFRFLKIAPQVTIVCSPQVVIDISAEISPVWMVGFNQNTNPGYSTSIFGVIAGPGVRCRARNFAFGAEWLWGKTSITINQGNQSYNLGESTLQSPRMFIGLHF